MSLYDYALGPDPSRMDQPFWKSLLHDAYKAVVNSGNSVDLILDELINFEDQESWINNFTPSSICDDDIPF